MHEPGNGWALNTHRTPTNKRTAARRPSLGSTGDSGVIALLIALDLFFFFPLFFLPS